MVQEVIVRDCAKTCGPSERQDWHFDSDVDQRDL